MTAPRSIPAARYAWVVVLLLWPVVTLNYLDRQMVSTVRASMRADIPSIGSEQDFGTLMAVFMWVYAMLSPVGGFFADKFSRRWMVIGSLFVWSTVTYLTGHARTYHEMLVYRGLMGISEAFYMPAALAMVTDYHPGATRARAVGFHQTGIYAGMALGGIGGYIAQTSTWRNCFTWFGAAGVIYAVVLLFSLKKESRAPGGASKAEAMGTLGQTLGALLSLPAFWILTIYFTLPAISGWLAKNWVPTFLADTFHLKEGPAGLSATGYIHLASLAGVLIAGALADAWMRRTPRGRIFTSALGTLAMAPALVGLGLGWNMHAAIFCMILYGLGWGFFDCNSMPILCQVVRSEHRATGYGIMNLVSISVGAGATVCFGWLRDHHINMFMAFAIAAALALFSAALILRLKPRADAAPVA